MACGEVGSSAKPLLVLRLSSNAGFDKETVRVKGGSTIIDSFYDEGSTSRSFANTSQ